MIDELIAVALPVVAAVVGWNFKRQVAANDKVTDIDKKLAVFAESVEGLKELINTRFDSTDQRIGRIERSMNGHLQRDL